MNAPVAQPVPAPTSPDPAKPGYATTEFWSATVAPTIFLLLSQFNVFHIDTNNPHVEAEVKLGSYILAAIGYGFYALSRGHMKKGAAIAAAINNFTANLPGVISTAGEVLPQSKAVQQLEPLVATLQAIDPHFSEEQLDDLSSIVGGIIRNHGVTKADIAPLVEQAVTAAVNNVLSNANSPDVLLNAAKDVKQVEDVVQGATAVTTPAVDEPPRDGATFEAPQFQ